MWLAERRQELRPVPYLHVVFPLPQARHELVRRHPKDRYDILWRAAAQALMQLAMDPHDVGGLSGRLCVLHTWTRTLAYHPHVPCLVPAGGVSADRTAWRPARTSSLVPGQALATLFRGLLLDLVRQERPDLTRPASVRTQGWVVSCTPTVQGTEHVLNSLGRSVPRVARTHHRLLAIAQGQVRFRDQNSQDQRWRTMTLPAHACIRRCLQQVLPQGFHNVRYDGWWRPAHRPLLPQRQRGLAGHAAAPPPSAPEPALQATEAWRPPLRAGQPCPACGPGLLVMMRSLPRRQRGPP